MEEIRTSNKQAEMHGFEEQFALWQQRYREYLKRLADFRQQQKGFYFQTELWKQRRHDLQDRCEDLKRAEQEMAWHRLTRP